MIFVLLLQLLGRIEAFSFDSHKSNIHRVFSSPQCMMSTPFPLFRYKNKKRRNQGVESLFSSFDDEDSIYEDDEDLFQSLSTSQSTSSSTTTLQNEQDLSGATTRQFNLGYDIQISSYAGALGFDEVIDWEYFDNPGEKERNIVEPSPLDPMQPKRTRSSSGSVIRIFRGEFVGSAASTLRSQGLEYRVLMKEFSGDMAESLASAELETLGRLQSDLCSELNENAKRGDWDNTASSRYLMGMDRGDTRKDDMSLIQLMQTLSGKKNVKALPFVGILGQLNLSEYQNDPDLDPNEWYRALGVPGPKPNSIWIVYEYTGLSTLSSYSQPPLFRRAKMPPKKGMFGNPIMPPPLPPWNVRANYVIKGVLKQTLEGLAQLHENGIAHRSIGRSSIVLSTFELDKSIPSNIYTTNAFQTTIKFSDFGFAGIIAESSSDESFRRRAKTFGVDVQPNQSISSIQQTNFAIAEDLHAVGFVFLGVLLTTLAEPPNENYQMPNTDEDALQRLLGEIFQNDIQAFREYCAEEEIWDKVVALLDENDQAGWELVQKLCFARERVKEEFGKDSLQLITARGLLSSPLFG